MPIFFLIIFLPLIELYGLIKVGQAIGGLNAILLCIVTAAVGLSLVRNQGMEVLYRAQQSLSAGETPVKEVFHGLCLLVSGFCLLVPGFFSDVFGFLLLAPALREEMGKWMWQGFAQEKGFVRYIRISNPDPPSQPEQDPDIIEGEFREIDDDKHNKPND